MLTGETVELGGNIGVRGSRKVVVIAETDDPRNPIPEIVFFTSTGASLGYLIALFYDYPNRYKWAFAGAVLGLVVSATKAFLR